MLSRTTFRRCAGCMRYKSDLLPCGRGYYCPECLPLHLDALVAELEDEFERRQLPEPFEIEYTPDGHLMRDGDHERSDCPRCQRNGLIR